mmetsp:Transcript_20426/g.25253  ORF Transcript_20426/g.25253 Transcript_20426/m.25253 type:complete len:80 (+) Transcript_20426:42-281(+)
MFKDFKGLKTRLLFHSLEMRLRPVKEVISLHKNIQIPQWMDTKMTKRTKKILIQLAAPFHAPNSTNAHSEKIKNRVISY